MLFLLALLFYFPLASFAQDRVVDNAGLLNAQQEASIRARADSLSAQYNFDLVIVTERDIGSKSAMEYADDYFDYNGYGLDGCIFLQVTGSRDYWFSTSGRGIELLTSTAFSKLESDTVKHLSAGNPYEAYMGFLNAWEEFLELDARYGRRYNFFHRYNSVLTPAAWLFALLVAFLVVHSWKKNMNTALAQTQAALYIVSGSLNFNEKTDRFLYSHVTKTAKPKQVSTSGGGRVHTGSSGRSHGGGGGRY